MYLLCGFLYFAYTSTPTQIAELSTSTKPDPLAEITLIPWCYSFIKQLYDKRYYVFMLVLLFVYASLDIIYLWFMVKPHMNDIRMT